MKMCIFLFALFCVLGACSDNGATALESGPTYKYNSTLAYKYGKVLDFDESVLSLDSISGCLTDSSEIEYVYKMDSVYVERKSEKEIIAFPSQIHSSVDSIKSIGVRVKGDTLRLELIEKDKTPKEQLYCPVWVYATLKGKIEGKFILTFTGVYPLVRK